MEKTMQTVTALIPIPQRMNFDPTETTYDREKEFRAPPEGQSKCKQRSVDRFVLWYFAWRVAVGLHKSVSLNFLIAGHTKFAPDWCFGLLKRAFKRNLVPAQSVLETVVNESSSVNIAQVVGYEDGTTVVPVSDWQAFFKNSCKPLHGIKKYQHFRFDDAHPGSVFVKEHSESAETEFNILMSDSSFPRGALDVLAPPGLPLQRQQYLYKSIREYVDEPFKDTVCPKPDVLSNVEQDETVIITETRKASDGHERVKRGRGKGSQRGQTGVGRGHSRGRGQGENNGV
ncbi:uncharacterized protein LOC135478267 [Liolophura sinensis]|uniref:uncharacterized protein LOC135478267 n=1 Tax=Liolophura sinensis TaxID=3198878 RepID=UPI0031583F27